MFRFLEIGEVITEDTCTTVFTSCQGGDVVPSAIKKVKSENESSDSFCLLMKFFFSDHVLSSESSGCDA